jgi:hypothetical protein
MNRLVDAFAPIIVAGFALQQLLELLDPLLDEFLKPHKKLVLSLVGLLSGLGLALGLGLRVLAPLGVERMPGLDVVVTALLMMGGTKWINDLMKILRYRKEEARQAIPEARLSQL